jgi:hypothetical protein
LNFEKKRPANSSFALSFYFLGNAFVMSVSAIVVYENIFVEQDQRKRIAEELTLQADRSGEIY